MAGGENTKVVLNAIAILNELQVVPQVINLFTRRIVERVPFTTEEKAALLDYLETDTSVTLADEINDPVLPPADPAEGEAKYAQRVPDIPAVPPYTAGDVVYVNTSEHEFFVVPAGIGIPIPPGFILYEVL